MSAAAAPSGDSERRWQELSEQAVAFVEAARSFGAPDDADEILRRELTGPAPFPSLLYLVTREPGVRARFLPELLAALTRGPTNLITLVRDVIRSCPRSAIEEGIPSAMEPLLASGDDEDFYRISEVLVELRLEAALDRLMEIAGRHEDPAVRDLLRRNEGVVDDPQRWGRLVQEWPFSSGGAVSE